MTIISNTLCMLAKEASDTHIGTFRICSLNVFSWSNFEKLGTGMDSAAPGDTFFPAWRIHMN